MISGVLVPTATGKYSRCIEHSAVLFVEVGERHRVYFVCGAQSAVKIAARKGETCVRHQICSNEVVAGLGVPQLVNAS